MCTATEHFADDTADMLTDEQMTGDCDANMVIVVTRESSTDGLLQYRVFTFTIGELLQPILLRLTIGLF